MRVLVSIALASSSRFAATAHLIALRVMNAVICGCTMLAGVIVVSCSAGATSLTPSPTLSPPSTETLGAIGYSESSFVNDPCTNAGANCTVAGSYGGSTYAAQALFMPNLMLTGYVNPSVSAYAASDGSLFSTSIAVVAYNFEVVAPRPSAISIIPVVIDLSAQGSIFQSNASTFATEAAILSIADANNNTIASYCLNFYEGQPLCRGTTRNSMFSATKQPINIYANQVYTVTLAASAEVLYNNMYASASVDPFLSIDPITLSADPGAQLFLSPGVQQSATPLPAALPLFITGLGMMGLLGCSRKRKSCRPA
jgi:hypothetical protein